MKISEQGSQKPWRTSANNFENKRQHSRSRSREKKTNTQRQSSHLYLRKFDSDGKKLAHIDYSLSGNNILNFSRAQDNFSAQNSENERFKEVVRSLLRIEQGRDEAIDKFAKIAWTYKNRLPYDHDLHEIMTEPKKFMNKLTEREAENMIAIAEEHRDYQKLKRSRYQQYWECIIWILKSQLLKNSKKSQEIKEDYQYKVKELIKKPLPQLVKLQKQTQLILKNQNFGAAHDFWSYVLGEIKSRKIQLILQEFYEEFKVSHLDIISQSLKEKEELVFEEPTSPTLLPFTSINTKLIVDEQDQRESRRKLAQKIFKEEFEKGRERLEINLSLPHNHLLLSTEIIAQKTEAYDHITKEIIEFEKYKRMEEDEEEFNDWVPCETEGRFRDRKPYYLNRKRVACQWNKYNSTHYSEENPPPKSIQGYKFNIFYPELYDKQKTPQYYLQDTDDPNYCVIKFKAGPPYKDIAFKILKKEWDFTLKSGFESIFSKGILQLYFNFKKPKYRI